MNNRTAIRTAMVNILSGHTSAGTNVYTNRETKLWQSEMPAILIYTLHEPAVPEGMSGRRYVRKLQLAVKIKVEASATVDDNLDALTGAVEDLISANPGLNGTVSSTILTLTEVIVDSTGEQDIATATLNFECTYIS